MERQRTPSIFLNLLFSSGGRLGVKNYSFSFVLIGLSQQSTLTIDLSGTLRPVLVLVPVSVYVPLNLH